MARWALLAQRRVCHPCFGKNYKLSSTGYYTNGNVGAILRCAGGLGLFAVGTWTKGFSKLALAGVSLTPRNAMNKMDLAIGLAWVLLGVWTLTSDSPVWLGASLVVVGLLWAIASFSAKASAVLHGPLARRK